MRIEDLIAHEFDLVVEPEMSRSFERTDYFLAAAAKEGFDCAGTVGTWGSAGGCIGTFGSFGCCC